MPVDITNVRVSTMTRTTYQIDVPVEERWDQPHPTLPGKVRVVMIRVRITRYQDNPENYVRVSCLGTRRYKNEVTGEDITVNPEDEKVWRIVLRLDLLPEHYRLDPSR